ncbi:efflux RND transporter periplasmic adaptor subunit [Microbacteriaceae bacterium VKM Ac-2854]|nr:efflux RND transporter periplasmic adaptor subunit [Microbacteriaceae bacterium VKM Ac-2854]
MVIIAVAAGALVKLAFFPDTSQAADPTVPTGEITEPTIPIGRGTVTNDLTLQGTVAADPAVPVKATAVGTVDDIYIPQGSAVAAGDLIFDIRVETVLDPVETTNPDGTVTVTQPKPAVSFERVYAPAAGVLSSLSVIHDQAVTVGAVSGQVAPPSFSVTGSIEADKLYRIQTRPAEATITITNGPAPFTCTGLTISTPLAGSTGEDPGADPGTGAGTGTGTGAEGSGTSFRCAVPAEVTVFPGLAASVVLAGGKAENVLVAPTTAVKGTAQTGVVYLWNEDGSTTETPVTLGLSDGTNVEITGGIDEGAIILQFVPGAAANPEDPTMMMGENCVANPDGSVICS